MVLIKWKEKVIVAAEKGIGKEGYREVRGMVAEDMERLIVIKIPCMKLKVARNRSVGEVELTM